MKIKNKTQPIELHQNDFTISATTRKGIRVTSYYVTDFPNSQYPQHYRYFSRSLTDINSLSNCVIIIIVYYCHSVLQESLANASTTAVRVWRPPSDEIYDKSKQGTCGLQLQCESKNPPLHQPAVFWHFFTNGWEF